jgi:transketolase
LNRTSDTKAADAEPVKQVSLDSLKSAALQMRRDILSTIAEAGSGHPGGSLSAVELLTSLYYTELRHDPSNPGWPDRDKFVLSKAHACPVLYVVLAHCGYFPKEELGTFRKINSRLQGHAHTMTPGVEMSGGSLGQGLSFAVGTAIAGKLDGRSSRVFAMLGDGECDEGQVWEAAMSASHYRLDNLVAIVDRNGIQNDRFTSEVMNLEPLPDKWRSFGWHVIEADGHSFPEVLNALDEARSIKDKPTVIIAATVKGKGVSFMENNPDFHGKAPSAEQLELAFKELAD